MEQNASVLTPTDAQIRYNLYKKPNLSMILLALAEEPCYASELAGRLCFNKQTILTGICYLENCGIIVKICENITDERIKQLLAVKRAQVARKLPRDLARNTAKRMDFYNVTQRGQGFLEHARKIVFGGEPL